MQQRNRLTRANRKPLNSFDQLNHEHRSSFNLLDHIQNQNLYQKLVTFTLQMSHDAGVGSDLLHQLQSKLLAAKGLNQDEMLNPGSSYQQNKKKKTQNSDKFSISNRWIDSNEQLAFLSKMEKEVEEANAKESLVCALKKYISDKKKAIEDGFSKKQSLSWKDKFKNRAQPKKAINRIQRTSFYKATLREILRKIGPEDDQSRTIMQKMQLLKSVWGHTFNNETDEDYCPVYNAIFDNTDKLIITGGEDGLIKIWSRDSGLLISNLRGYVDYINKITVTKCNKYLLSAGNDCVRFFDLNNMTSMGGFKIDAIMDILSINDEDGFKILFADNHRLFMLDQKTMINYRQRKLQAQDFQIFNFQDKVNQDTINTILFAVNSKKQILLGNTSGQIVIFNYDDLFTKRQEIEEKYKGAPQFSLPVMSVIQAHASDILELKWHRNNLHFVSGGKKDGNCRVWDLQNFEESGKPQLIKEIKISKYKAKRKKKAYLCNYICYNSSYTYLACSFQEEQVEEESQSRGDGQIMTYNLIKKQVTWEISRDFDLSAVKGLQFHPFYPNILLAADSSGKIILLDIYLNTIVNIFEERALHLGHPSFCLVPTQCKFSQDGNYFLVPTQYGNVSLYGYDIKSFYDRVPTQQFYSNQFDSLEVDRDTFKPVIHEYLPLDVNQMERGPIKNIRKSEYLNLPKVQIKKFKQKIDQESTQNGKLNHRNELNVMNQTLQMIKQSTLDYERCIEIYKKNLQQLEHKRLTVLYDEKEKKNDKMKEIIQQKIGSLRNLQNGQSVGASLQKQWESTRNTTTRRRGRAVNKKVRSDDQIEFPEENFEFEYENQNKDEEDYQQNISDVIVEEDIEDEQFDSQSSSSSLYNNRNRNRRRQSTRTTRRLVHPQRRYLRHRQRRPAAEELQELQQQYDEYNRTRKRYHRQEDDIEEEPQNQRPTKTFGVQRRSNLQSINEICDECRQRQSKYQCYFCREKRFCDHCKQFHGKKLIRDNSFSCFECIYLKNQSKQRRKNKTDQKYKQTQRNQVFLPQIEDEVVFFFQGYEEFLTQKIQFINNKYQFTEEKFPLRPHEHYILLKEPKKCIVKSIQYVNPMESDIDSLNIQKRGARGRFTRPLQDVFSIIRLESEDNIQFNIFYIPGHQFLLKWQIYDDIIKNDRLGKLKLNDLVFLKGQEVQIISISPMNPKYETSIWKNLLIHKAVNKNLRHRDNSEDVRINLWNLDNLIDQEALVYETYLQQQKRQQYIKKIQQVQEEDPEGWEIFHNFVDNSQFKDYYEFVEVGICLNHILQRLNNNYYRSQNSFIKDMNHLLNNSIAYNGESYVTEKGRKIVQKVLFDMSLKDEGYNEEVNNKNIEEIPNGTQKKLQKKKKGSNSQKRSRQVDEEALQSNGIHEFEIQQHQMKRESRNSRRKYKASSEEQQFCEFQENKGDQESYERTRRRTRNMKKSKPQPKSNGNMKNSNVSNKSASGRLTRSKFKK